MTHIVTIWIHRFAPADFYFDPYRIAKMPTIVKPAERIQQNILAAGERRLLTWLAARMPSAVTPDKLTIIGFFGATMVGAGYALSAIDVRWLWMSIAAFIINWFGDSLDGSLARFRQIERPRYGYFIDHSMDSLGNMLIVIGIGLSPFVRMDLALFALCGYFLLSIHTFIAARVVDEFRLSYVAAGPTELRLLLIAMTLTMLAVGPDLLNGHAFSGFDMFVGGLGTLMVLLFIGQTASTGAKLRKRGD